MRRDEFGDVHGLGRLDDLESAGRIDEGGNVALCAVAFSVNLKLIAVHRDLALGHDAQRFGDILAGVLVRGHGMGHRFLSCAFLVQACDNDLYFLVRRNGIAGNGKGGICQLSGSEEGELRGGELNLAKRLSETGALVAELNLGAHIFDRGVGAVEIAREVQRALCCGAREIKALVVARIGAAVESKALGVERGGNDLQIIG